MGAASSNDLAAALGRHARTEAVAALANQLARLIRPLHGTSPVDRGSGARWLAPVWLGKGSPPKLSRKNDQRPRRALSACGLMTEERGKVNAALAQMRQSGGSPLVRPPGPEPDRLGADGYSIEGPSRREAWQAKAPGFSRRYHAVSRIGVLATGQAGRAVARSGPATKAGPGKGGRT